MHTRRARAWSGLAKSCGWLVLVLIAGSPSSWGQSLPPGQPIALPVENNHCECILPTSHPNDKFFLIVGSASLGAGPYRVSIQTALDETAVVAANTTSAKKDQQKPAGRTEKNSSRLPGLPSVPIVRIRGAGLSEGEYPPAEEPLRTRNFFLFVKERDFYDPQSYVTVSGELKGVGRHCQVYVDRDFIGPSSLQPTVDDIIGTFDHEVYPRACRTLGRAADVDRDGRFTILLTPWLGKLSDGKVSLGGFVRGSDFFRDLAPPYGNRCDMMYLNTNLGPGPDLRSILAHEYTHAVIFSEHMFGSYQPQAQHQDEEGWLNEGVAHVVEDLHGYSWSNLDYRISAFLSAPERYQLVVPDYFRAGLFRSHGHRGAAYLFLRWCCDRYGDDFLKQLVQTNLTGTANVEAATHERFADLFREWTIALALSGSNLAVKSEIRNSEFDQVVMASESGLKVSDFRRGVHEVDIREPLAGRVLCGPRFEEMVLDGGKKEVRLLGTSAAFLLLHSPAKVGSRLTISWEAETNLQVTLIRLPEQTGRLDLLVESQDQGPVGSNCRTVRLGLTAHDQDVVLEHAAWERLVPTVNRPEDTSYRPSETDPTGSCATLQSWFGDPHLKAGEARTSQAISLPRCAGDESWVFKISAIDAAGHHLSAWAVK